MGNHCDSQYNGTLGLQKINSVQVLLRLNDLRKVPSRLGESLEGTVSTSTGSSTVCLSMRSPTLLDVTATSSITIEFNLTSAAPDGLLVRSVGQVELPVEFVIKCCSCILHRTWLLVTPKPTEAYRCSSEADRELINREFEHIMRASMRDVTKPMACFSVCPANRAEAAIEHYTFKASAMERSVRFPGLILSLKQHARILHGLYRKFRTTRSDSGSAVHNNSNDSVQGSREDLQQLQEEIDLTRTEASSRVSQAQETIQALMDELRAFTEQAATLRDTIDTVRINVAMEETHNESLQLMHAEHITTTPRADEVSRLRHQQSFLREQKDALIAIVEEIHKIADTNGGDAELRDIETILKPIDLWQSRSPEKTSGVPPSHHPLLLDKTIPL